AAEDLERFRARRGHSPEVILQSGDGGARIVYGKPFFYALAIAPLVRVLGERGATLANAIALAIAALLSARALTRRGEKWGPLWIAVALFASVTFGHVYWIHPDLFLMACTACGLALAHLLRSPPPSAAARVPSGRFALAWGVAGALLVVPGAWRPPYLLLLVPGLYLALGADRSARARSTIAFVAGAALLAVVCVGGQELVSGNWSPYGGERRGFSDLEGFPGVDFPAAEWSQRVEGKGNTSWLGDETLEVSESPSLAGWNLAYLVAGRTVGLLPYFLPALVAPLRRRNSRSTRIEVVVGLVIPFALMLLRPFNFYGGAGAVANRYFLPVFPLFWFGGAGLVRCLATTVVAAPFVLPLWLAPAAYPIVPGEGYRYVSEAALRLLPVETTQRHVKAEGRPDVLIGDLWVRFLDGGLTVEPGAAADTLVLAPDRAAEILVGRASPLTGVVIEALDDPPTPLRATGPGTTEPSAASPKLILRFERATARHPMWWTDDDFWLYRIEIEATAAPGGSVPLRLRPIVDGVDTMASP
ncbi:MAG TPA: hypothetical protein VHR17_10875, partial [Thermoanaerobaculia bacterium]|nr:hypothetical protein [Thermoanaerobaculia bacterium]